MRSALLGLVLVLVGTPLSAAQDQPDAPIQTHPAFRLQLDPLYLPGYEPARELHLALWDSPMSRLELAVAREQWALRNPGPTGAVIPFEGVQLPLRLSLESAAQPLVMGPWSPTWKDLTWQEKVAAGAQTGFVLWVLVEALGHAH
jgi:hypothetical protein